MIRESKRRAFSWPDEFEHNKEPINNLREALGGRREALARQLFLLCVVVAFNRGEFDQKVPKRKTDGPRFDELSDENFLLLDAVALAHAGDRRVLLNQEKVFDIAEQYAAAGLRALLADLAGHSAETFTELIVSELYLNVKNRMR